jgi:hypothetical protein
MPLQDGGPILAIGRHSKERTNQGNGAPACLRRLEASGTRPKRDANVMFFGPAEWTPRRRRRARRTCRVPRRWSCSCAIGHGPRRPRPRPDRFAAARKCQRQSSMRNGISTTTRRGPPCARNSDRKKAPRLLCSSPSYQWLRITSGITTTTSRAGLSFSSFRT